MRIRPFLRAALPKVLLAALVSSLCLTAPRASASIDAVDESSPQDTQPKPRPRPQGEPRRSRQAVPAVDAEDEEVPERQAAPVATPPPARAGPEVAPVAAPPTVSAAVPTAPAQPPAPAPAPPKPAAAAGTPPGVIPRPIAMPKGSLDDLLTHFRNRQKALSELDSKGVEAEGKALRDLRTELSFPEFETVAQALTREGQHRLEGHMGSQARTSARLAVDLAPNLPEAWWLLARADIASDGTDGFLPAAKAASASLQSEVADPLDRRALLGNLAIAALWAALVALALTVGLLAFASLRYLLHDFHHLFPKGASAIQTGFLGLVIVALPWLFRMGPFAILASLAVASWLYLERQGRIVAGLTLALAVATPFILGAIAANTAVSPLALDLWTAERDLDAETAVAHLTALAQNGDPSPAVLRVLGDRAKRLGHLPEAEADYRRALKLEPGRSPIENNLANVLLLEGDLKGAQTLYESAIDHNPAQAASYFNLGQDFSRLSQLEQGQEAQRHALELDRTLIEQHMGQDARANQYLIDIPIDFADVATVGSVAGVAARGVREQAQARLFGPLESIWMVVAIVTALLLAALGAGRRALRPSAACRKCGRPVCQRCDPGLPGEDLCGQCVNVFLRKSVADPPARIRKEARVRAYQVLRVRFLRALSLFSGGGGHVMMGEVALGALLLFGLVFFLSLAAGAPNWIRAPESGIAGMAAAGLGGVLLAAVYLLSVRDLFGKTR